MDWVRSELERLARNRRKKELRAGAERRRERDTEHSFDGRLELLHRQGYTDDMLANALGWPAASYAAYHRNRLGLEKNYKNLAKKPK